MRDKSALPRIGSSPPPSALARREDTRSSPGSSPAFPNWYKSPESLDGTVMTFVISLQISAGFQLVPHRLKPFAMTNLPVMELFIDLTMS